MLKGFINRTGARGAFPGYCLVHTVFHCPHKPYKVVVVWPIMNRWCPTTMKSINLENRLDSRARLSRSAGSALALLVCSCMAVGCASDPHTQAGLVGGAGGGVIGAGTGAIIGASITNGAVLESAALGGAIGIPVGVAAGLTYIYMKEKAELDENDGIIKRNYDYIVSRQTEIDRLRAQLEDDAARIVPDQRRKERYFDGATIGNYGFR
jgi:hypothetical protein